ncbi:MAG TPA: hypothetical protein VGM62_16890 [Chthoniobacterales bacterium]|jgi:hypothetical protein
MNGQSLAVIEPAKISDDPAGQQSVRTAKRLFHVIAIMVPAIAITSFFLCLWRYSYNFPYFDDFEVILGFLNSFLTTENLSNKVHLLFEQHGEHRVVFDRAIALAEYWISGKIDFRSLILIGNAALAVLLILFYRAVEQRRQFHPLALAPIALILFNFRYFQTIFWAMAALQNLWVLCFAFGAFYFLFQAPVYATFIAILLGLFATYTSGNGMAVFVAGAIVLALNRQLWTGKAIIWSLGGVATIASYFYGYVKPLNHPSVIKPLTDDPLGYVAYVLALFGGVFTENIAAAVVIGSVLVGFAGYLTFRKYFRENPIIYTLILFLLLTSIGSGAARFEFGIEQALVSRYTIISTLFVVCCYLAFLPLVQNKIKTGGWIVILVAAVCFHYTTYAKYLPEKKQQKAEFEKNYARIVQGKLTHFDFGWPPLDIRRQLPRQVLRTADSLRYFPFKFKDVAEILDSLPSANDCETAYVFERFQQVGPAVVVFSGWALIRGVSSDDVIPVLCLKEEHGNPANYMVLQKLPRTDVGQIYPNDHTDYSQAGFGTVFNRNEIKPGKYTVSLLLATADFKTEIEAGPTVLGQ